MRLNNHLNSLYIYVYLKDSDGLKLLSFFENFDETFINYNIDSLKKEIIYYSENNNELNFESIEKKDKLKLNFFDEFFL
ncbi:hypothetical protein GW776_00305 [archaeon]|jgi:hypothetical protein|nr:hypothetical protein [archaeon]